MRSRILITGSSGFLGREIVEKVLSKGFVVHAVDTVPPKYAPNTDKFNYHQLDICDTELLYRKFSDKKIDYVVHLAAYWNFKLGHEDKYQRVNIQGTKNILDLSETLKVKRFIFASSIEAIMPKLDKGPITEESLPNIQSTHPYGRSKAQSEIDIHNFYFSKPRESNCSIVRISGVFDYKCELPPLAAIIRRWLMPWPLGGIIPGKGKTGFSYLHRTDFTNLIMKIIDINDKLEKTNTLLAASDDITTLNDLYPLIRKDFWFRYIPIYVPTPLVRLCLAIEKLLRKYLPVRDCIEEDWMFQYIDKPIETDPSYTFTITGWKPDPNRDIKKEASYMATDALWNSERWNCIQDNRLHKP